MIAGNPAGQLLPRRSAVGGFIDAALRAAERAVLVESLLLLPQRRVHDIRILGIDPHIVAADVLVLVKYFLKRSAAVRRPENPTLRVRPVRVSQRRHEQPVGVSRVHLDIGDHLRIAQPQVRPRLAGVRRFVHPVAHRQVGPDDPRSRTHVNHIWIRLRYRNRSNRPRRLFVEQRLPRRTEIRRSPYSAVVKADIKDVGLTGNSGQRPRPPRSHRPDGSPVHFGIQLRIDCLSRRQHRQGKEEKRGTAKSSHSQKCNTKYPT